MLKGSFTIEATVIMIIFLMAIGITMNMALVLYDEVQQSHEEQVRDDMWMVNDFYRIAVWK